MKVKLPASIHECKPDQLVKWIMLAEVIKERQDEGLFQMLDFQCQVISIFSGLKVNKVKQMAIEDVHRLSSHVTRMLSGYVYSDPIGEVSIDGKQYVFEKDFRLISTGQIIDLKLIEDISSDPVQALAICYIEEGMEYCEEDDRGRVLNPNEKRYAIFKEQFDGAEFMNFFSFFFARIREAERRYSGDTDDSDDDESIDDDKQHKDQEWFVWTRIIQRLGQELGTTVDAITKQPYVKTLFWMNYIKLKDEQENILMKQQTSRHG